VGQQAIWRIRTDQEVREIYKDLDIATEEEILIRHGVIEDKERTYMKIFEGKPEGSRRRGRP
jgi:hypothetical protein